jgi:preprotein translocase subunit YajC
MMEIAMVLAQAASRPAGGDAFWGVVVPMLLVLGVFYFFMFRGQKKERRRYADMLANLKRNDRVQTAGGVLGTVVDVRDTEVVLKVDESNNVKIRFSRGAIKEVLAPADEPK